MQEVVNSNITASSEKQQLVKINSDYSGSSIIETFIDMTPVGAKIIHMDSAGKNKAFGLKGNTMDAAVEAWMNFRAQCASVDAIEIDRVMSLSVEVASICEDYPEIVVEHHDGNYYEYWSVTCDKLGSYSDSIRTVDALLEKVQDRKARIDQGRAEMKAIKDIIATHPEIRLEPRKENGVTVAWHIQASFNSLGWTMMVRYARNVTELLEEVQAAQIEVATVKESYRIANEHGLTITKTGSGWTVSTSGIETGLMTRTHKVEDLIRTVCEIVEHTSPQTLTLLFSHDEMQMLETVQEHLDAPQTSAEHVSKAFGLALTTQEFDAVNALGAE